ncbi:MAG: ATP-binding cassette domain-containing protein, partial [bacterium]
NGAGKTTILRIICGQLAPEGGRVNLTRGTTFGYLPQEQVAVRGRTLVEEAMSALESVIRLREEQEKIEKALEKGFGDREDSARLLRKYGRLQEEFEKGDGYSVRTKVENVLSGLGFAKSDWDKMTEEFSGGWQMRIALARILLSRPNVLLLDEPTNHLDLESMTWLEDYLDSFEGTIVVVSHDRYFMDRIARSTAELEFGKLTRYPMSYTAYLVEKERRRESLVAARKHQQERIEQLERFIERFKAKASKASQARSRMKMLEKMERIELPQEAKSLSFQFPPAPRCARRALELVSVSKAYGKNPVFEDVNLLVERKDRIAVIGINGAGKSTLLRIMSGMESPSCGERKIGGKVNIQYFSQRTAEMLDLDRTVLEEVEATAPDRSVGSLRGLLGGFLFSGDDVFKKVRVLSGGEKCRLAIAKILLASSNLLLLDEPTNHLDQRGRDLLEQALAEYKGAFVLVTHDRYLIDRLVRKILLIENGSVKTYLGNYTDYLWKRRGGEKKYEVRSRRDKKPARAARKEQKRRQAVERQKAYEKKKATRAVEEEIETHEQRIVEIEKILSDPETYKNEEVVKDLVYEDRDLREKLGVLYEKLDKMISERPPSTPA